uniref:Zinc finger protein 395a n=1 Tax=Oryzias melastigma TaxID=30732 RepID=A0A3B3CQV4_ORYME
MPHVHAHAADAPPPRLLFVSAFAPLSNGAAAASMSPAVDRTGFPRLQNDLPPHEVCENRIGGCSRRVAAPRSLMTEFRCIFSVQDQVKGQGFSIRSVTPRLMRRSAPPSITAVDQCLPASTSREGEAPPTSADSRLLVTAVCDGLLSSCSSRGAQEVDMDELMAAMVLSSLSCSPPPKAVPPPNCAGPSVESGPELSDSGSSGHWSVDVANGSSAPSSPATAEPESETLVPPDEGLDMELDQVLFDEPAPRKRRNSVKVAYRCLWPSCGKVLTSVVGIKRHIRTTHLWRGGEHERCSRSEEDFYYTEINQPQSPPHPLLCGPGPASSSSSPSSPPSPPPPSPPSPPGCDSLSRSAPSPCGSSWQVQSEHSYQAPPPSHMVLPAPPTLCRLTTAPVTCSRPGSTFRVRSVSVGEQWLQHQGAPCRRIRSEAKKCRKVYGIEHRDQWCTACRWKKACQRFLD